jgi:peptidase C39-like protein
VVTMRFVLAVLLALGVVSVTPASPAAAASSDRLVGFSRWEGGAAFRTGERAGVRVRHGALVLEHTSAHRSYRGTRYDVGSWTSPWASPGFGLTQLVASWSASTPRNSWVEVRVRTSTGAASSRWQVLGRWASGDKHVRRTSVSGQSDALGRVDVDTWKAASATGVASYQVQVRLMRRTGASSAAPALTSVAAMASNVTSDVPAVSAPGPARGVTLEVPQYSQMVHAGELAQYGGGGEAWCSPTSTAMVLGYYGRLPSASSYAWVGARPEPWVDEVARRTYDTAYEGTGNWPFNTAYAASRGLDAFVTRLRSLTEAEALVAAGIPVIASVSFSNGALAGAPISSTAGHLLVIVGFTATGDVVVNDPAASSSATVRRTYDRAQLEAAWLGGSGGTAYVIHDAAHPLPASPGNW